MKNETEFYEWVENQRTHSDYIQRLHDPITNEFSNGGVISVYGNQL